MSVDDNQTENSMKQQDQDKTTAPSGCAHRTYRSGLHTQRLQEEAESLGGFTAKSHNNPGAKGKIQCQAWDRAQNKLDNEITYPDENPKPKAPVRPHTLPESMRDTQPNHSPEPKTGMIIKKQSESQTKGEYNTNLDAMTNAVFGEDMTLNETFHNMPSPQSSVEMVCV